MVTCLGDLFYPEVGVAIVRLLRRLGVAVDFPAGQTCCGLPLFNSGYHVEAARAARRTLDVFRASAQVVVPSGSCAWMVKHEYPGLVAASERADAEALAARTYELSQFLVHVLGVSTAAAGASEGASGRSAGGPGGSAGAPAGSGPGAVVRGRLTYHDSCHLLRGLHESAAPRALLASLPGTELVELPGSDECCGFGGSFAVRLPEISSAILERKLRNIEATGAGCVVACDAGCLMQIRGGLGRRGSPVRALHLAEVLEGAR
jgi:L-lactate dehydrogenase complex protein LldE